MACYGDGWWQEPDKPAINLNFDKYRFRNQK